MKKSFLIALCAFSLCSVSLSQTKPSKLTPRETVPFSPRSFGGTGIPLLEEESAQIDVKAPKNKYLANETIELDIALKNVGTKGCRFEPRDAQSFYQFEIIGPDEKQVPVLAAYSERSDGGETWGIAPGESRTMTVRINSLFDMTMRGQYKVVVAKKFRMGKDIITVKSKPMTIEVTSTPTTSWWH